MDLGQLVDCIIVDVHIGRIPISQLPAIISHRQKQSGAQSRALGVVIDYSYVMHSVM